jgi:microsomal epoxide hydrolase
MSQYSQLPSSATLRPTPFEVKISDADVDELKLLVKLAKLPPDTYENQQADSKYGINKKWIADAKTYWETQFDWWVVMIFSFVFRPLKVAMRWRICD